MTAALAACAEAPVTGTAMPAPLPAPVIDERDPVSLLPDTVDSVLTVDVAVLRASAFARPILTSVRGEEQALRRRRGFDEVDDVEKLVFARVAASAGERATIELLRGRFDLDKVAAAFSGRAPDASPTHFGKVRGVTLAEVGVALISPQTVIFGPPWALRVMATVRAGRAPSARSLRWLSEVDAELSRQPRPSGRPGEEIIRLAPSPGLKLALRSSPDTQAELTAWLEGEVPIEQLGARLDVDDGARGHLLLRATSEPAAIDLADRLRDWVASFRERPAVISLGLDRTLAKASVASRGKRVALALEISSRDREIVAARLARLSSLLGARPGDLETKPARDHGAVPEGRGAD